LETIELAGRFRHSQRRTPAWQRKNPRNSMSYSTIR
jgi:hypothetical protein